MFAGLCQWLSRLFLMIWDCPKPLLAHSKQTVQMESYLYILHNYTLSTMWQHFVDPFIFQQQHRAFVYKVQSCFTVMYAEDGVAQNPDPQSNNTFIRWNINCERGRNVLHALQGWPVLFCKIRIQYLLQESKILWIAFLIAWQPS